MKRTITLLIFLSVFGSIILGCGGTTVAVVTSTSNSCAFGAVQGVLQDSLTNAPISNGWISIETGSSLANPKSYFFTEIQKVAVGANGAFVMCRPNAIDAPYLVLVAVGVDDAGKAYPPFVTRINGTVSVGTIDLGGCALVCGLPGQQQSAVPAVITGTVTSDPISGTGTIAPHFTLATIDGSGDLWDLAIPTMADAVSNRFDTASANCYPLQPLCISYAFSVPSQMPLQAYQGHYVQMSGAPTYAIAAILDPQSSCKSPMIEVFFQTNGSPLTTFSGSL